MTAKVIFFLVDDTDALHQPKIELSVILETNSSKQADVRHVDADGRDHYSTKITLVDGSERWDIDLGSSLSPGTYILHEATERGEELVERVVVE